VNIEKDSKIITVDQYVHNNTTVSFIWSGVGRGHSL